MFPGTEQLEKLFDDFEGAAMSLRFEDAALELRMTAAGLPAFGAVSSGDSGVEDLPGTSAVAYGIPISDTYVEDLVKSFSSMLGEGEIDRGFDELESQTGLTLPEDLQTMLGDGLAVALDSSADFSGLDEGPDAVQGLPVGLRINGDPDEVAPIVEKLLAAIPMPPGFVNVETGDDAVAIGLDPAYVAELAGDGDLGEQDGFQAALPDLDDGGLAVFVDFNGDWLTNAVESDPSPEADEVKANLEPLKSLGLTSTSGDDEFEAVLRLTTD